MKKMLYSVVFAFCLSMPLAAQTCRELVRDSSGRIVQTVERRQQAGGGKCQPTPKVPLPPPALKR